MEQNEVNIQILKALENINEKFVGIDQKFDKMDKRFEEMDKQFEVVNGQLKGLQNSVSRIEDKLDNHVHEFRSHFKHLDRSLKEHRYVIDHVSFNVESDIRHLKARVQVVEEEVFGDKG
ncbi:hypothetical protein [Ammoniphilus sp. YIM 78166]|uniref:hypothetical protein n=1 Tax=Ammoniphilus sp. YIM 78166 TaxID=1644106 RepID=UPI00106FA7EC|nr:hypothetical protein [Ammoniphilus sp. YIM 78166]